MLGGCQLIKQEFYQVLGFSHIENQERRRDSLGIG